MKQKNHKISFIVFEKVFDTVKHDCLIETLKKYGVDGIDIRVLIQFYWPQKTVVRVAEDISERLNIEIGV